MAKQVTRGAMPRLRFPGFEHHAAFVPTSLGRAFRQITNGKANAQDHEEGGAFPLFDRSEVVKASSKFAFDSEAVILPGEGMSFRPRYFEGKFNLHQRVYSLMGCQGHSKYFYYALDQAKGDLALKAVKSTVLSLRLPIIEKFVVFAPPDRIEQQKIADCLTSLDEVIAAQGRKVEAMKAHKRGLMQQLFPREGETRPRLRFPEFRNAPDWRVDPLRRYIQTLDAGVSVNSEDRPARTKEVGILKTSCVADGVFDPFENKVVLEADEIRRVKESVRANTIIISRMNTIALVGANAFVERDMPNLFLPDRLWAAKPTDHAHPRFLAYAIGSGRGRAALSELAAGSSGTMKNIGKSDVLALEISAPALSEQQRIAEFFASLDTQIAAESNQLAALKTHKQGLMQQLFPAPEAASA